MLVDNQILVSDFKCVQREQTTPESTQPTKKCQMHPLAFCLNLFMMITLPYLVIFFLFYKPKQLQPKGYAAISVILMCLLVMLMTILHLRISLRDVLKTLTILDSMWVFFGTVTLAFVGMMCFIDQGRWQMKIIIVAFLVGSLSKFLNIRLLLFFMKWKRIQVISFKIGLFVVALTYFNIGVYSLYKNYSFTYNILKVFDQQFRYFVLLFTFAAFEFTGNAIKIISAFDYSDTFRDVYIIKDVSKESMDNLNQTVKKLAHIIHTERSKKEKDVHFIPVMKLKNEHKQQESSPKDSINELSNEK